MSLLPEKMLVLSPQLAATLGLEEALLYQYIGDIGTITGPREGWLTIRCDTLLGQLPFWDLNDLRRILTSLEDKGVVTLAAPLTPGATTLQVNLAGAEAGAPPARPSRIGRATRLMSGNWEPAPDVVSQLTQIHGISADFVNAQVAEFVTYWSERNEPRHSWNAKFLKHVIRLWRDEETRRAAHRRQTAMTSQWRPSADAVELLNRKAGISLNFIEDAIPEFVLYWRERGETRTTWNSDFVRHVKNQWARYTATLENDREPRVMTQSWQPSEDLFEVLALANIPRDFALAQIPEFKLFWRDNGQAVSSWNTKFLQHVKRQWARHCTSGEASHERHQRVAESVRTRDRSLVEDLTDRSWAN